MSTKKQLISFHGKQEIKDEYLKRLEIHYLADDIIQGTYWQNGKGCAVGCTIHGDDHDAYETELGIPAVIAMLEDRIFERLPNVEAKEFPIQFLSAIPVGKDLVPAGKKFFIWLLADPEQGVIKYMTDEKARAAVQGVADLFTKSLTEEITVKQWIAAWDSARAALDALDARDARDALDALDARDALDALAALDALDALDALAALDARDALDALDALAARDALAAPTWRMMRDKLLELLAAA